MAELPNGETTEQRFVALYQAHYAKIEAYARRRVGVTGAREVVAETFLAAWVNIDRLPDDCLPWLYRAARYEVATHLRSRAREVRLTEEVGERVGENVPDIADAASEQDSLMRAFAALDDTEREILSLVAWDGVSSSEGAKVLGCTVSSFRVRLHRARERFLRQAADQRAHSGTPAPTASGNEEAGRGESLHISAPTALEIVRPADLT